MQVWGKRNAHIWELRSELHCLQREVAAELQDMQCSGMLLKEASRCVACACAASCGADCSAVPICRRENLVDGEGVVVWGFLGCLLVAWAVLGLTTRVGVLLHGASIQLLPAFQQHLGTGSLCFCR